MSWITILWSMSAAACLTLAAVHFGVWFKQRAAWANFFFAITAIGTASLAAGEIAMMRAGSPFAFGRALLWTHLPAWVIVIGLAFFIRFDFGAGRPWLAWSVCGVRTLSLILNFCVGENLNYLEVTQVKQVRFMGELISVAQGKPNPLMLIGQLSFIGLVIYMVDATVTVWRQGDRHRALVVGGSMIFFVLVGTGQASLVLWQIIEWPLIGSLLFLNIVLAMGYELSRDLIRLVQLNQELHEVELQALRHRVELAHLSRVTILGKISGVLSHELNQPLGAILSNAEAAELHLQKSIPDLDEVRNILGDIRRDNLRASEIIRRMRRFLHKREQEMKSISVSDLISETVEFIRLEAASRKSDIRIELEPGLRLVLGDFIHLQQVLLNLMINGMDAMNSTPAENRRLTISAVSGKEGDVEIAVTDTGTGLAQEELLNSFTPFYTSKQDGLGLGLSICQSIIEAHGGTISVENNPDGGATGRFTLKPERAL